MSYITNLRLKILCAFSFIIAPLSYAVDEVRRDKASAVFPIISLLLSENSQTDTADFKIENLSYTGAFRLTNGDFGASNINYAVGILGFNPEKHSLFIAGHAHHNAIAEYPIPEPGMQTVVSELPETGSPLQNFVSVLDVITPSVVDRVTGMLWHKGSLIVNAEVWYDAAGTNVDTTLVISDANNIAGSIEGYYQLEGTAHSAGYMGEIPDNFQNKFSSSQYYTGWSSVYSVVSRYSVGPSLWAFDPTDLITGDASANPQIEATPYMNFGYPETMGDRALEWAQQGTPGPFPPASKLWNPLSKGIYGFFIPGTKTYAVIGSTAGLISGIGYKAVQQDGTVCGGPCAYIPDDYYNYYWLFDVDEILNSNELYEPRPYAYGVWDLPFDNFGVNQIIGATLDSAGKTLYIAIENAGQVGTYDRPPLVLTYSLP